TLSIAFTSMTESSKVIPAAQQQQIARTLEHDAQVVSNTQLARTLESEPEDVRAEVLRINRKATDLALQIALLVPILASLGGLAGSRRMRRLPDPESSGAEEQVALG